MSLNDSETPPPNLPPAPEIPGVPGAFLSPEIQDVPEDIRAPWGWTELGIFVLFALGSLAVLQVALQLFVLARFRLSLEQLKHLIYANASYAVIFQACWAGAMMLFLCFMARAHYRIRFWPALGWRKLRPRAVGPGVASLYCILGGILMAVVVGAASGLFHDKAHLPIEGLFRSRKNVLWLMAFGIPFAPVWEETVFRGFLYPLFARKLGVPAGIVVTGVLFGLMHAVQLWGGWVQIGLLILVGIVLTGVRAASKTVVASFLVHLSYNTFLFSAFFIGTGALRHFPPIH